MLRCLVLTYSCKPAIPIPSIVLSAILPTGCLIVGCVRGHIIQDALTLHWKPTMEPIHGLVQRALYWEWMELLMYMT